MLCIIKIYTFYTFIEIYIRLICDLHEVKPVKSFDLLTYLCQMNFTRHGTDYCQVFIDAFFK